MSSTTVSPEQPSLHSGFEVRRLLLLWLVAAGVCVLALRFFFPGYLDPFVPFHLDHYIYLGMHAEAYGLDRYFLYYPRPIAHVLIDLCGRLGVRGLLVPLYILTWLNAALLVLYLERVMGERVVWLGFLLYTALAYSNPEFYWNLKQDPFSTFALAFLLCIFHAWQSYLDTQKKVYLGLIVFLVLLLSLTKESYFVALTLFLVLQYYTQTRRRRAAIFLLIVGIAFMGFGLFRSAQVWALFPAKADPGAVYYTSLAPKSVWHGFLKIGKYLAVPAVGISVLGALIGSATKERRLFFINAAMVLLGAVSLLPNATLPNHLEAQYAFLGAYFFLAPLLFTPRLLPPRLSSQVGLLFVSLLIYGLALLGYRPPIREVAGLLREYEKTAQRMLPGIDRLKAATKPGDNSLVVGATMFYDPFLASEFILSEFGSQRFWTVVVSGEIAETKRYTTQLIHESGRARLARYDNLFVFAPDGRLITAIRSPSPAVVEAAFHAPDDKPPR
jgi:hypothetical protein